ncbi:TPA: response regulator [Stenotrophomonas maltophilia]|nr:response regulator [Stenotrophomonas maltophilia]
MRILLIEDDAALADGLIRALQGAGHLCDHLSRGLHAPAALASAPYDVMVLDLSLPDVDGLDLLSRLRNDGVTLPVLILTARDGVEDRILGLDRGGDDYLAKPFALGELEARLRALSRRRGDAPAQKRLGRLCFDSIRNEAQVDGQRIELTARELSLVEALMQHPGRTVTKQRLFDALYSWDHEANLSVIEVHVSRLRRKLEQARAGVGIRMLRGLGYRLEAGGD